MVHLRRVIHRMATCCLLLLLGCAGLNVPAPEMQPPNFVEEAPPDHFVVYPEPVRRYRQEFYVGQTEFFKFYFVEDDYPLALRSSEAVDHIYRGLSEWYGASLRTPYSLFFVPDKETMYRMTGGRTPHIGLGGMVTSRGGTAYVMSEASDLHTIAHELSHLFVRAKTRKDVPRWFDEGLAVYLSTPTREDPFYRTRICRRVLELDRVFRWYEMERPDFDMLKYEGTYEIATSILIFLSEEFGEVRLREALDLYAQRDFQGNFAEALKQVCGIGIREMESQWQSLLEEYAASEAKPPSIEPVGSPILATDAAGHLHVSGEVRNNGHGTAHHVQVVFEFLSPEGESLGQASAYMTGSIYLGQKALLHSALRPGASGIYEIKTDIPYQEQVKYTYKFNWRYH